MSILNNKLKSLNISDNIIQWVVSFLTDRIQFVKIGEMWSFTRVINHSIVQDFGIAPTLFVKCTCIIDLKPIGSTNYITKYADDTSLLVHEKCDIDINLQFQNVLSWASKNKLMINISKTKELVFYRPNPSNFVSPVELRGFESVRSAKLLGVVFQEDLGMKSHINCLVQIYNQRTYFITWLNQLGLLQEQLMKLLLFLVESPLKSA